MKCFIIRNDVLNSAIYRMYSSNEVVAVSSVCYTLTKYKCENLYIGKESKYTIVTSYKYLRFKHVS